MTIWGCKTGLVKDDGDDLKTRAILLKQYPGSVELDRRPGPYEKYIQGQGLVKNTDQEAVDKEEALRIEEHEIEKESFKRKTLKVKEDWVKDRLQETTLDAASKTAIGRIFRKIIAFID